MQAREKAETETTVFVADRPATRASRASSSSKRSESTASEEKFINGHLRAAHDISSERLRSSTFRNSFELKTSSEDIPEALATKQDDQTKPPPKTHNTRLRNGIHKVKRKMDTQDQESEQSDVDKRKEALIDACAKQLSEIDKRAQRRALLRDANSVLENIIFPMALPWSHRADPVIRTLPPDIDEIPGIRTNAMNRCVASAQSRNASVSRSNDPGVLELTRYGEPKARQRNHLCTKKRKYDHRDEDNEGELVLRLYEETEQRKRLREDVSLENSSKVLVSVRFGCSSSRSTLFDEVPSGKSALLTPAILLREVSEGKHVNVSSAQKISSCLGTYDCRHGLPDVTERSAKGGERAPRTFAGRTRLLWTTKEGSSGGLSGQRHTYRSLVSGEKMDHGSQRRPRTVKVGIRVNGQLVSVDRKAYAQHTSMLNDTKVSNSTSEHQTPYPDNLVKVAIEGSFSSSRQTPLNTAGVNAQCSLDLDRYQRNMSERLGDDIQTNDQPDVGWRPPRLDCVANEDGKLSVLCSYPGFFDSTVISDERLCTCCLRFLSKDAKSKEENCLQCGSCNNTSVPCHLCGHKSGKIITGTAGPVHDLCAAFHDAREVAEEKIRFCHLCSRSSKGVVSCAAENCQVAFHPWCARVVSRLHRLHTTPHDISTMADNYLSTQFSFDMLHIEAPCPGRRRTGSRDLLPARVRLPVAYCGFHNPKRQADYSGLYPEARNLRGALQIPPGAGLVSDEIGSKMG